MFAFRVFWPQIQRYSEKGKITWLEGVTHCRLALTVVLFALALFAGISGPAHAQVIEDLFNTGVADDGTRLATNGVTDTHYANGTAGKTFTQAGFSGYHVYPDANYLNIDRNIGQGSYTVTFNTTFTLPENVDLNAVLIGGTYSIDNIGEDILINGRSAGVHLTSGGSSENFIQAHPFTLPTGFYQRGVNTLGFVWTDVEGPGAIAIAFTSKFYASAAAPEPNSLCLFVSVLLGAIVFCRLSAFFRKGGALSVEHVEERMSNHDGRPE